MTVWLRPHLDWLKARDLRFLTGLAAVGVLLVTFIEIARAVDGNTTRGFDEAILLALRTAPDDPIGSPSFTAAVMHISALGSGAVTGLIVLLATVYFALAGRWRYALLMVLCSLGTLAGMMLLKGLYERERPTVVMHIDPPGGHSFPSGHSMISAALYMTLAVLISRTMPRRRLRAYVVAAGALLTMLIGTTRLYLGVHYPTDVLAGWTFGALLAVVAGLVVSRLGDRDVPPVGDG